MCWEKDNSLSLMNILVLSFENVVGAAWLKLFIYDFANYELIIDEGIEAKARA